MVKLPFSGSVNKFSEVLLYSYVGLKALLPNTKSAVKYTPEMVGVELDLIPFDVEVHTPSVNTPELTFAKIELEIC